MDKVAYVTRLLNSFERVPLQTHHLFHAGMYSRTIRIEAGQVMTGALMRVATVLIVKGSAHFICEKETLFVDGYAVIPGSAGRQTVMTALSDVMLTMIFPTHADSVEAAEREFTDQWTELLSRESVDDTVVVTGE